MHVQRAITCSRRVAGAENDLIAGDPGGADNAREARAVRCLHWSRIHFWRLRVGCESAFRPQSDVNQSQAAVREGGGVGSDFLMPRSRSPFTVLKCYTLQPLGKPWPDREDHSRTRPEMPLLGK